MKRKIKVIGAVLLAAFVLAFVCGCAGNVRGNGSSKFTFKVTDKAGVVTTFEIRTDEKTVGDALLKEKLIEGEASQYGLYVKVVNGVTADYNVDGTYWAFYVNGEYATSGVDTTPVTDGALYEFRVEK